MKQPKPDTPQAPQDPGPSGDVQDAWMHSFDISKGLDSLFYAASCSDEGITAEGCKVIGIAVEQLVGHMKIVDVFFNPAHRE